MTDSGGKSRLHRRALPLAVALFLAFVLATGLYARHGYAFVLKVYETHQIARAEDVKGARVALEYGDYLRVDPASLLVRGLLINRLIDERKGPEAVDVANEGVEVASEEDRPIAELLLARAKLANGDLDEAEEIYNGVLNTLGESNEAQFMLAHIHAVKGMFKQVEIDFSNRREIMFDAVSLFDGFNLSVGLVKDKPPKGSTPDFLKQLDDARDAVNSKRLDGDSSGRLGVSWLFVGYLDEACTALSGVAANEAAPLALFWKGACAERLGNLIEARRFYRLAAERRDPLAIAALERLGRGE